MYAKIQNGSVVEYPYGETELRRDFPNTSFPSSLSDEDFKSFDAEKILLVEPPSVTHTKKFTETTPSLVNGVWQQTWIITDKTAEEISTHTDMVATDVRRQRDAKLAESDWTQVADAPVDKAAWATYRQALRDITDQAGFPYEVTWPTKPE